MRTKECYKLKLVIDEHGSKKLEVDYDIYTGYIVNQRFYKYVRNTTVSTKDNWIAEEVLNVYNTKIEAIRSYIIRTDKNILSQTETSNLPEFDFSELADLLIVKGVLEDELEDQILEIEKEKGFLHMLWFYWKGMFA